MFLFLFLHVGDTLSRQPQGRGLLPKECSLEEKESPSWCSWEASLAVAGTLPRCCCSPCPCLPPAQTCLVPWTGCTLILNAAVGELVVSCPVSPPGARGVQVSSDVPYQVQPHPAVLRPTRGCGLCLAALWKNSQAREEVGRDQGHEKVLLHFPAGASHFPHCPPAHP